jgi:hypothetical protein
MAPRIGGTLATLGLVGLLVASGLPSFMAQRESAAGDYRATGGGAPGIQPEAATERPTASGLHLDAASPGAIVAGSPLPNATDLSLLASSAVPKTGQTDDAGAPASDAAVPWLLLGSAALLAIGLFILAAAWRRRRPLG